MAPKSVLVCEDNEIVRKLLCLALEEHGFIVTRFATADAVLDENCSDLHCYDVVITDFEMPGMKGDEFARYMRSLNSNSQVIIISGSYVPQQGDDDLDIEFLGKPFAFSHVLKRISEFNKSRDERISPVE